MAPTPDGPTTDSRRPGQTGLRSTRRRRLSRRSLLLGGATALTGVLAGCSGGGVEHGWLQVGSPTSDSLYDVVLTAAGPCAVGDGGTVLTRRQDNWKAASSGSVGSDTLYGASATDDGRRVWFCGDSGAVGAYDVVADRATDHSAPGEKTSSWTDVAVAGRAGSERVALVNSSGEFLLGRATADGVRWESPAKPTGGESATAVDVANRTVLVADSGGGVYARRPASGTSGPTWETVGIGGQDVEIRDLVAVDPDRISVVTATGAVYAYGGYRWLRSDVTDGALHAVTQRGTHALAVGAGGSVLELTDHRWQPAETPTDRSLYGCALDAGSYSDVAVGTGGTILERFG